MKRKRFGENQAIKILKEAGACVPVAGLWRSHGFSHSSFYNWKAKRGGVEASALRRFRELEEETQRLKQMHTGLSIEYQVSKDVVEKSSSGQRFGQYLWDSPKTLEIPSLCV